MFKTFEEPDQRVELLEDIWSSASFTSLSQTEQEALRARYGTGEVVEAPAPVAAPHTETAPKAAEPSATPVIERRGDGKPPLKRVFKGYRVAHDGINDKLMIVEDVDVYDDAKGAYEPKQGIPTKIGIPESLQGRIMEPAVSNAIVEAATEVRTKLDESGLKLFLDEARWEIPTTQAQNERTAVVNKDGSVKRLYLKWKYKIEETQRAKDFLDLSEVPDNILKLLKEDKDYWKRPEWKKWFGVQMQKKREEIISQEILRAIGQGIGEAEGPEMDVQTSTEVEEAEETVEVPKPAAAKPMVTAAPAPKVDVTPVTPAPTPTVDAAPAAAAATPDASAEVSAEQLAQDVATEVRRNVAAYRRAYNDDLTGLANRAIGASFVLLTEKYALAHAPMEAEHLFRTIKDATEAQLGLAKPTPKAEATPAAPEAVPAAEATESETFDEENGQLTDILHGLAERALKETDATPTEVAFIADKITELLQNGTAIKHLEYVPGKRLRVTTMGFFERVRKLHQALREQHQ
jgi:hypothetical protein